ncbi:SAC3 family protein C-like protein [Drosera capensis]
MDRRNKVDHRPNNPSSSSSASNSSRRYLNRDKLSHKNPSRMIPDSTITTQGWRRKRPDATESNVPRNRANSQRFLPQGQHNDEEERGGSGSDPQFIVGTCPFMCPVKTQEIRASDDYSLYERERLQRERLRDLAVFERLDGDPARTSSGLAVKKFCRTVSIKDIEASDVRPLPVLDRTLNYLLELFDSSDHPFETVHDFIFDRIRSIRQDLSMQNIIGDQAISMYEKMVKFHVISHHKLRKCATKGPPTSPMHHLNMEQLIKSLASLYNLCDINRKLDCDCENEAEFRSLYIFLHLGSQGHNHIMGESLSLWLSRLPPSVIRSKEMLFARTILSSGAGNFSSALLSRFYHVGNFWRFFYCISKEATYLQLCMIETCINEVRAEALACINHGGYKLHPYPLTLLCETLKMKA